MKVEDIIQMLCSIPEVREMKTTIKQAKKGALVVGTWAFVGCVVGGPTGLVAGAVIGSLIGAWMTSGQFKPIPQIIMELSPAEKQKLFNEVMVIINKLEWTDTVELTMQVMENKTVKQQLLAVVNNFMTKK